MKEWKKKNRKKLSSKSPALFGLTQNWCISRLDKMRGNNRMDLVHISLRTLGNICLWKDCHRRKTNNFTKPLLQSFMKLICQLRNTQKYSCLQNVLNPLFTPRFKNKLIYFLPLNTEKYHLMNIPLMYHFKIWK